MAVYTPRHANYGSHARHSNSAVERVVESCRPALKKALGMSKRINCGWQGCVYKTTKRKTVAKITVGKDQAEAHATAWQRRRGAKSHMALPRVNEVYKLGACAAKVTKRPAYVTVREDLHDIPENNWTREAVNLLKKLERELGRPGAWRHAAHIVHEQTQRNYDMLKMMHRRYPLAYRMWVQVAHLQVWLSRHGLTMFDTKLSNLGLRKPGRHGAKYDVVVRDMGLLDVRSTALAVQKSAFRSAHKRAPGLGWLR